MAPKFELIYFDFEGRVSIPRMMLRIAGVEFTDTRLTRDEWAKVKGDQKRFVFGQVPAMIIHSETCPESTTSICQSRAITRYLANEYGFFGKCSIERAQIDAVCCKLIELMNNFAKIVFLPLDEAKKALDKYIADEFTPALHILERVLGTNKDGGKFFVGDKVSMCDLCFLDLCFHLCRKYPSVLDGHPKLKSLSERLISIPAIKEYIPTRKLIVPDW